VVCKLMVFEGATSKSLPPLVVRNKYPNTLFELSANHWSNEEIQKKFMKKAWQWKVEEYVRDGMENIHFLDCWPVNLKDSFRLWVRDNCPGLVRCVPAGDTDRYQVADVAVHRPLKHSLQKSAQAYYQPRGDPAQVGAAGGHHHGRHVQHGGVGPGERAQAACAGAGVAAQGGGRRHRRVRRRWQRGGGQLAQAVLGAHGGGRRPSARARGAAAAARGGRRGYRCGGAGAAQQQQQADADARITAAVQAATEKALTDATTAGVAVAEAARLPVAAADAARAAAAASSEAAAMAAAATAAAAAAALCCSCWTPTCSWWPWLGRSGTSQMPLQRAIAGAAW
jgi:hypothetical protein